MFVCVCVWGGGGGTCLRANQIYEKLFWLTLLLNQRGNDSNLRNKSPCFWPLIRDQDNFFQVVIAAKICDRQTVTLGTHRKSLWSV